MTPDPFITGEIHTWNCPRRGEMTGVITKRFEDDTVLILTTDGRTRIAHLSDLELVPEEVS